MVCVFAREITGPLTSLVKQLDASIAENPKLKAFVVVLTDAPKNTAADLERLAAQENVRNVPLTLIPDTSGPEIYQIAKEADVTVMMWEGAQVEVNHAYGKGEFTDESAKTIVAEIPKFLRD